MTDVLWYGLLALWPVAVVTYFGFYAWDAHKFKQSERRYARLLQIEEIPVPGSWDIPAEWRKVR